jgi:hypothetical protein
MTDLTYDAQSMLRVAQPLVVEARYCDAQGGIGAWQPQWNAVVQRIEIIWRINPASHHSVFRHSLERTASDRIWLADPYPHRSARTSQWGAYRRMGCPFDFILGLCHRLSSILHGGDGYHPASEEVAVECRDFRWLLAATSPVFGQFARSVDQASANQGTFFSGRTLVFNADGKPDKDPVELTGKATIPRLISR